MDKSVNELATEAISLLQDLQIHMDITAAFQNAISEEYQDAKPTDTQCRKAYGTMVVFRSIMDDRLADEFEQVSNLIEALFKLRGELKKSETTA